MKRIAIFLLIVSFLVSSCVTVPEISDSKNLKLKNGEKELFWYYVEKHTYDRNDAVFKDIEIEFMSFNPDLVLVEGSNNIDSKDKDEAIRIGGESRFTSFLGYRNNKVVEDIEPPFKKQIEYLVKTNDIDAVYAMFLIRLLNSDKSRYESGSREIVDIIKHSIGYLKYLNTLLDVEKEIDNTYIEELFEKYYHKSISNSDWYTFDYYSTIYNSDGALYYIRNKITEYRNIWLVQLIKEKKTQFNKIFIMMGSGHLMSTKSELADLFK